MGLARRTRWMALALPVAVAVVASLARPAPPGVAAAAPLPDRGCSPGAGSGLAAARATHAWYRLDTLLDAGGTLAGRRLTVGRGPVRWAADLPAESFASGPVGGRVVVGDDDGVRSRLRMLDTVRGCWSPIADEAAVIRSAVLASGGERLYEHRVDRATRSDLGVWQRDLAVSPDTASRVLPGLGADAVGGPTFTTDLLVAADGRLVASSCGLRLCRTRVLEPQTGAMATVGAIGPAIGAQGGDLLALTPCTGLPCPIMAVDLRTSASRLVGDTRGPVVMAADAGTAIVVADGTSLGVLRLGARPSRAAVGASMGLSPLSTASTAESGVEAPPGLVAVAPDGRIDDPSAVRFLDPVTLRLTAGEVLP